MDEWIGICKQVGEGVYMEGWVDFTSYCHHKICAQMDGEAPEELLTHLTTQPLLSSAP